MKKFFVLLMIVFLVLPVHVLALEIKSPNVILIEMESGKTLYEKEADAKVYPASTTKILTSILALENAKLEEEATASYQAIMSVPYDATTACIQIGETWTIQQLVEASLVCSANEAANILAEYVGGDIDSFASMMNSRARELGADTSHFVNANGLHDDNQYTTARDMATIARYGMLNLPEFRKAAKLTNFSLPSSSFYNGENRSYANTNKLLLPSSSFYYPYATGIKTGFTSKALNCMVASANKDGVELLVAIYGAGSAEIRMQDAIQLFDYGFEELKAETFLFQGEIVNKIKVSGATPDTSSLNVISSANVVHAIPKDKHFSDYPSQIQMEESLKAPLHSGDVVGTISYEIEGVVYQYPLLASHDVNNFLESVATVAVKTTKAIGKVIFWGVLSVIGILIALVFLRASVLTKRQRVHKQRMLRYNARFRR